MNKLQRFFGWFRIPHGSYCYRWKNTPPEKTDWKGKAKLCPFYVESYTEEGEPYCDYARVFDLILLGDFCKICGKREWDRLYWYKWQMAFATDYRKGEPDANGQ